MEEEAYEPFGTNLTQRYVSPGAESHLYHTHSIRGGTVELVDYMGGDGTVERVATAGHGRGIFKENPSQEDLIRYLVQNGITAPFASVQLKFSIQSSIETALSIVYDQRANVNEYSGRYSEMLGSEFIPTLEEISTNLSPMEGKSSPTDISKRAGDIHHILQKGREEVFRRYKELLGLDLARELSRSGLGTNNHTRYFWKMDLPSLASFIERERRHHTLRIDPTQDYLDCLEEIASQAAPLSWEALQNGDNFERVNLMMPIDDDIVDGSLNPAGWKPQETKRVVVPDLEGILFTPRLILDHGAVQAVDYMGDDSSFAQAARTSYGKGTKTLQDDKHLIRSLIRDLHTTPIEMSELAVEAKIPVFSDPRQAGRHRTLDNHGFMGYVPKGSQFYMPPESELKYQDRRNRQGRGKEMEPHEKIKAQTLLRESFEIERTSAELLREIGAPEELVRSQKGVGFYTKTWRTGDTHNWGHFLMLRMAPDAQKEVRDYANEVNFAHALHTPTANEALHNYIINGMRFSEKEVSLLATMLREGIDPEDLETYKRVGFVIPERDENRNVIMLDGEKVMKLGREGLGFKKKLLRLLNL